MYQRSRLRTAPLFFSVMAGLVLARLGHDELRYRTYFWWLVFESVSGDRNAADKHHYFFFWLTGLLRIPRTPLGLTDTSCAS